MNRSLPIILLFLTALLASCEQSDAPAENQPAAAISLKLDDPAFTNALAWQQVRPALIELSDSLSRRTYVQGLINEATATPAAVYLKAMLYLASSNFREADRLMLLIPTDAIPATFVYAPYRLQERLGKTPNTFLAPMVNALDDSRVSRLIKARVYASTGRLEASLEAYLATDPQRWTNYDVRHLKTLYNQHGLRPDTTVLINRAENSGRLQDSISQSLMAFLASPGTAPSEALLKSPYAAAAIEATLAARKAFVNQDFSTIVEAYTTTDARAVSDELNLMLVVASAALEDEAEAKRWAVELKRRFPDQETREWIANLLNS